MEQTSNNSITVKANYVEVVIGDKVTVENLKRIAEETTQAVESANQRCIFVDISLINYGEVPIDVKITALTLIHYSRKLRVAIYARDNKLAPLVNSAISFANVKDYQVFGSQKTALEWLLIPDSSLKG
jgi:hypothetical protein